MARILLTWELGSGLGHVTVLQQLAERLIRDGQRVYLALKDLSRVNIVFSGMEVACVQAPIRLRPSKNPFRLPSTFAHVLHNNGFEDIAELRVMTSAWRAIYEYVQPDLIIFDHSPTALLASWGYPTKRLPIGVGFCCPPPVSPLPDWRPWLNNDPTRLHADESRVLATVNRVLTSWGCDPLQQLTDLYRLTDDTVLTTFRELDHFANRQGGEYWGGWPGRHPHGPTWPKGTGKRVFAYLRPFQALPALLEELVRLRFPTIAFADGLNQRLQECFACETLRFENTMLDLTEVGKQCDMAILNASHGTTACMLLAGRPLLLMPRYLEQQLTTQNVVRMGAAVAGAANNPRQVVQGLQKLVANTHFTDAAERFAERYSAFSPHGQLEKLTGRIRELLVADPEETRYPETVSTPSRAGVESGSR